jgi:hypothetical protein
MIFVPKPDPTIGRQKKEGPLFLLILMLASFFPATVRALPSRLVLALDGVSYRDLKALQDGFTTTNFFWEKSRCQAFTAAEGYFPVSRMISTFPSSSDVAWTDIFGDRPLPGYQRTYFSAAADEQISINGVTTSMEHERQMDWQVQNGFRRAMGYMYPVHTFEQEVRGTCDQFWNSSGTEPNFYVYIRASDDAQHLDRNIFNMLCLLDRELQDLRARYRAKEGRDLQILILSDHGHNHAGRGRRVEACSFLKKAGYHVAKTLAGPKDVVLPTAGIESWVEIHNDPDETENLVQLLWHLKGVDIITAPVTGRTNRFVVVNSQGERAFIDWRPANNSFRYSTAPGDPLNYRPVLAAFARNHQLDADGFASADDWMAATATNHYPLAPERIVRGLTRNTLNPATILISLDNRYVNDNWPVQQGSRLVTCGSTHGGLDDINSDGIFLSNFTPTRDTSTARVAGLFGGFPGLKNFRETENGAEWVTKNEQALTRIRRTPFDRDFSRLPDDDVFLRVWSPELARPDDPDPITVDIEKIPPAANTAIRRSDPAPAPNFKRQLTLGDPILSADPSPFERIYALPPDLILEPHAEYEVTGWLEAQAKTIRLFDFDFHTRANGRPAAY